jgi:hypothetical protein
MKRLLLLFNRLAEHPPRAVRLLYPPLFLLAALGLGRRRGWVVGIAAAIVYGGIGLSVGVAPQAVAAWSRRHPGFDGALVGPLLFFALAYLTSLDIWLCAGLGIVGLVAATGLGTRRKRLRDAEPG